MSNHFTCHDCGGSGLDAEASAEIGWPMDCPTCQGTKELRLAVGECSWGLDITQRCPDGPCEGIKDMPNCGQFRYRPLTDAEVEEIVDMFDLPKNITITGINSIKHVTYKGSPVKLVPGEVNELK